MGQDFVKRLHFGPVGLIDVFIVGDDLHPEGVGSFSNFCSNSADADEPQGFTHEFRAFERFLLPLAFGHCIVAFDQPVGYGQHVGEGQLRDGDAGSCGRVKHFDALLLGVLAVHVVQTYTSADDELQVWSAVDVLLRTFRLASHEDDIGFGQPGWVVCDFSELFESVRE